MKPEGRNFPSLKGIHWDTSEAGKGPHVAAVLLISGALSVVSAAAITMLTGSVTIVLLAWLAVVALSFVVLAYLQKYKRHSGGIRRLSERDDWISQPIQNAEIDRLLNRSQVESELQILLKKAALIIGRENNSTLKLQGWLEELHNAAMICHDPALALDWIEHYPAFFHYVLIDIGGIGEEASDAFLARLKQVDPGMKAILLVPFPSRENKVPPAGTGASNAIRVPIGKAALHAAIRAALRENQEPLQA